ncbi:MAG: hypothetical protein D6715_03675, partial [Calditrichaeota bacterium]
MQLAFWDWVVIGVYGLVTLVLGFWFTRRAGQSVEEYFVAGRSLPWWLAGTSIAATWFATDAPLATASLVRQYGIFGNWLWWYEAGGLMLLVFFFARYWHRAHIITDAEFLELRYSGQSATALRVFSALYNGVVRNCVIMGWVMLAMVKFARVLLGWSAPATLMACALLAVVYTVASGLWGVVVTDLFQFIVGLGGSILLAVLVLVEVGGPAKMVHTLQAMPDIPRGTLDLVPNPQHLSSREMLSYLCLIFLLWTRSGHDGYPAQRLFATRNDRNAMLAAFWWGFLGITVMTWPWIVVGLGSLIVFPLSSASPQLAADPELAYPMMLGYHMPVGLKGLLVASFLAAFMSTMDTHLCWGGSYLINDVYRRFLRRNASEAHYVLAARVSVLMLLLLAILAAYYMDSIENAWIYIIDLTAGMGILWALRWYWWRINAWAEIAAMAGSLVLANGGLLLSLLGRLHVLSPAQVERWGFLYTEPYNLIRAAVILVLCTLLWIGVTLITSPVEQSVLERFYLRVRPGGWWGPIARLHPEVHSDMPGSRRWLGW